MQWCHGFTFFIRSPSGMALAAFVFVKSSCEAQQVCQVLIAVSSCIPDGQVGANLFIYKSLVTQSYAKAMHVQPDSDFNNQSSSSDLYPFLFYYPRTLLPTAPISQSGKPLSCQFHGKYRNMFLQKCVFPSEWTGEFSRNWVHSQVWQTFSAHEGCTEVRGNMGLGVRERWKESKMKRRWKCALNKTKETELNTTAFIFFHLKDRSPTGRPRSRSRLLEVLVQTLKPFKHLNSKLNI